ncbi:MAG: group 1 truncated hemoglobin [Nitrospiraceae bacterium]|nr:group 1 truncated hemoglobin [Nitrospiraceae bacterium]
MVMKRTKQVGGLMAGLVLLVGIGCAETGPTAGTARPAASLYDRLGGKPAITAVVDQFVANVAADQRINGRFATTDIPKLKGHLVNQVCGATGGPCNYTGRDMKATHDGMKITGADFNALVQNLVAALDKFSVPAAEKNELLALLGPMKKDIVEIP